MGKIAAILTALNQALVDRAFGDTRFDGSSYYTLATYIPNGDQIRACVIDENGDTVVDAITPNMTAPMTIYHRLNSSRWVTAKDDSFGNAPMNSRRVMDMSLMVIYDKKRVHLNSEDMELMVFAALPSSIRPLPVGFASLSLDTVSGEHSQPSLLMREFGMKDFTLSPQFVLLEVKYKMECTYSKDCIQLLCCPD